MSLRIIDLINMPELHTRFLSGEQGLEKVVRWAHVCELSNPSEWLGEGDLLMTTGIGIPVDPNEQKLYISALSQAGIVGITIGENMQAPNDLDALQQQAEHLAFPLLMTSYKIPFVTITRAVIDANRKQDFERRNSITQVYISARLAIEGLSLKILLSRLEKDIQAEMLLLDLNDFTPYFSKNEFLTSDLLSALQHQPLSIKDDQPVLRRYMLADGECFGIVLPTRQNCALLVKRRQNHWLDYSLLHHVVAVLGIAFEYMRVESERALRIGSELIDDLLQLRLSPMQVGKSLESFNMSLKTVRLGILRPTVFNITEWTVKCEQEGITVFMRAQGQELITLLEANKVPNLQSITNCKLGLSDLVESPERFPEALREARLAWTHTTTEQVTVVYTQVADKLPWLAQSLDTAKQTFKLVLGELLDYDQEHNTTLLNTLRIFLMENRSWKNTAQILHIHKSTLIYRIRRIETITGRSLDRTEDVSVLWLALQAANIIGLDTR